MQNSHEETIAASEARDIASRPVLPELLDEHIREATSSLRHRLADSPYPVTEGALTDFVSWFAGRLADLTNLIVVQRYTSFHLALDGLWRPRPASPGIAPEGAGRDWLDQYVAYEKAGRLMEPDGPLPELGRLVDTVKNDWLDAVTELVARLAAHQAEVADLAGMNPDSPDPLSGAEFGISDPHQGGRSAAILALGPHRVVYKPRTLTCEIAWSKLAAQVVPGALGIPMRTCRTISGEDYGFMELVANDPCPDEAAVHRCYLRYGALLALAHAIGTFDLHHENVIVSSEYPLVIDAEPLLRTRLQLSSTGQVLADTDPDVLEAGIPVRHSVLESGLLPGLMRSPFDARGTGRPAEYFIGALTSSGDEPVLGPVLCGIGSDDMQVRNLPIRVTGHPNLPHTGHGPYLPTDYTETIVEGFQAAYEYLSAQRTGTGILSPAALRELVEGVRVRAILRPTMEYATLLSQSFSSVPFLSSQRREQVIGDSLAALGEMRRDMITDWTDAEVRQLMRGDIPRFELEAGTRASSLHRAPVEDGIARVASMDRTDLSLQVVAIREQLAHKRLVGRIVATDAEPDANAAMLRQIEIIADAFADTLENCADLGSWAYAQYVPALGAIMSHVDPEALYDGSAGTAVALAEAGRLLGRDRWRELAADIFTPLVAGTPPISRQRTGGMARGIGGLIFAMGRVGAAAGRDDILRAACRIAVTWGPELALSDPKDELLYGRAGLLLGFLSLHQRTGADELTPVIDQTADQLIQRAAQGPNGVCWSQDPAKALPHVSHGTSGIAMALARWGRLRENSKALDLAAEAMRFDDQSWRPNQKGWRDGRFPEDQEYVTWSWCNGRTGALLSRFSVAEDLGDPYPDGLTVPALAASNDDLTGTVSPGLCCGTSGAVDAFTEICRRAPDTGQEDRLNSIVTMLARRTAASHLSTLTSSLFTGTGGLLFALLRASAPDRVDSVLWFG